MAKGGYAILFFLVLTIQLSFELSRSSTEGSILTQFLKLGQKRAADSPPPSPPGSKREEGTTTTTAIGLTKTNLISTGSDEKEETMSVTAVDTSADFSPLLQRFNRFPEFNLPFSITRCKFVYLDLGTNQGRQLRKLFLGLAPQSMWAKKFNEYFGSNVTERQRTVCAIGAEPDRNHKPLLDSLEDELTSRGVRVKILRNPVWVNNDVLTFNSIYDPNNTHDSSTLSTGGFSVYDHVAKKRTTNVNLTKVELRGFRLSTLLAQIPSSSTVLAKLDIEGAEHRVIADIVLDGTICRTDFLGIEFHRHLMKADRHLLSMQPAELHRFLAVSQRCKKTIAAHFDDEG
ncbi:methyltransferase family 21, putative [Bodo saltans]|uniref:Methyltransferase family 21, putative n=1 Tax=Bodo saltans TaxID=75058 RepID=A0A0S4J8D9_BODSA|nr:methyltransferase family 21, putative [Bodo saltans]|eukprot:CUG86599.1 methyltransferase family 21, putative [Bodo saltans]